MSDGSNKPQNSPLPEVIARLDRAIIADLLNKKYAAYLDGRCFELSCQQEGDELMVTVLLSNDDDSFHYPIEARISLSAYSLSSRDACHFLCDYIDIYLTNYFEENEELYLPIWWSQRSWQDKEFFVKAQKLNKALENHADRLLNS